MPRDLLTRSYDWVIGLAGEGTNPGASPQPRYTQFEAVRRRCVVEEKLA